MRVYLDQRDWIALARQHYGVSRDEGLAEVLALVQEASARGLVSFPLSAAHYFETFRQRNPGRRQRLGRFMAQLSKFHTIAGAPDLLKVEVRASLQRLAGMEPTESPTPFGRGVRHAFGNKFDSFFADSELERRAIATFGEEAVTDYFEYYSLVGPDRELSEVGIAMPDNTYAQRQLDFELETARRLRAWGHSSDRAHRLILAQEAQDTVQFVNDLSPRIGLNPSTLFRDRASLTEFMLSLPAKGAVCRLRMTAHEDQRFRWHIGDLIDMTALATAAAYCDVVVAEKHWGNVLRRHAADLPAQITSWLLDLPRILI